MAPLSKERKKFLVEATKAYHESLPGSEGEEYLTLRGLASPSIVDQVDKFRLGFVRDPLPGHERYQGMLAIPYLRRTAIGDWMTISIRFRCIRPGCLAGEKEDHGRYHGKYNTVKGDPPAIYNTLAVDENDDVIGICEGEVDAITSTVCGLPAVGIPGVEAWQPYFKRIFVGYRKVYILADNDKLQIRNDCAKCGKECRGHNPGMEFAEMVMGQLPNGLIVPMPEGHDVHSTVMTFGKRDFLERIK